MLFEELESGRDALDGLSSSLSQLPGQRASSPRTSSQPPGAPLSESIFERHQRMNSNV